MLWMSLAMASSLQVERATHALTERRPDDAVVLAREAIQADTDDAEAWDVYLQACAGAGLAVACDAEASLAGDTAALVALRRLRLKGEEVDVPEIGDATLRSVAAGEEGVDHPLAWEERVSRLAFDDPDAAAELALQLLSDHPERPDVLAGLFDPKVPPVKSIAKAKKKIAKQGSKRLRDAEASELYRWLALWVATDAHAEATETADRLKALGEDRPLDRKPLTRAEQVRLAQAVIEEQATLPTIDPVEAEAVALKVAAELTQRGLVDQAAASLKQARAQADTVSLAMAEAEALLTLNEHDKALEVANEALHQVGEAWPTDRAVLLADLREHALAKALGLRGRVHHAAGRDREATIDLMIANQISKQPVDTGDLEKAFSSVRYQLETVKAGLETVATPAHERGMELVHEALEAGDREKALSILSDTIAALILPAHSKARLTDPLFGRVFLADALALRGRIADDADWDARARTDLLTALLLRRYTAPAAWWTRLAGLHATEEARFFADAMAAALDEETDRSHEWPGVAAGADAAAAAMVASWMRGAPVEDPKAAKITRGIVIEIPKGGGGVAGSSPALNAPFPNFVLDTPHGEVGLRLGRITLITFFRADSPNSRRAMRELSLLAQDMRRSKGVDAILVGVSVDPEEKTLIDLQGERDTWGPNGWDPGLGKRFGVEAVPTTFVIDSQGVARFKHVGYLGTSDYEAELRLLGGI